MVNKKGGQKLAGSALLSAVLLLAVAGLMLVSLPLPADDHKTIVINSGSSAPLIISDDVGFYPALMDELFRRLKIDVRTILLPSARSLHNGNEGVEDGIIARIKGIEKKFVNLVPVPEKIIDLDFVAYSKDESIHIRNWDDLQSYRVGYIRGWKIYDTKVKIYKSLEKAKDPEQLFALLEKDRVDVILFQEIPGVYWMKQLDFYPHQSPTYLDSREMYMYMHKRHTDLVPVISAELRRMKQDGSYDRIFEDYIGKLLKTR